MKARNHWPVNWVDGMKISKNHFLQQDDNLREQLEIAGCLQLTDQNYGLLESAGGLEALSLVITTEQVELHACRAVTRGGHYVEVGPINNAQLKQPLSSLFHDEAFQELDVWTVVLRVNTKAKDLIGQPDPEEVPLRHPYASSQLRLEVVPSGDLAGREAFSDAVPLARLVRKYQGVERVMDYIPPFTRTQASERLMQLHTRWQQQLVETENYLYEIVRKINDKQVHGTGNALAHDLLNLTKSILDYLNGNYDRYRLLLPGRPPVETVLWFMGMARCIVSQLRMALNADNLEKYIAFYVNDTERYQLLQLSNELKDFRYDHTDTAASLRVITRFLEAVNHLFGQLRGLQYNQIADPTIINSMRTGNLRQDVHSGGRGASLFNSPTPAPASSPSKTVSTGGPRKISIRRNAQSEPPPVDDGNIWGLEE